MTQKRTDMIDINTRDKANSQDREIPNDSGPGVVGRSLLEVFLHFIMSFIM